jgi:hypothetical protein
MDDEVELPHSRSTSQTRRRASPRRYVAVADDWQPSSAASGSTRFFSASPLKGE